jgi:collagenase-like PrtC family protease
MAGLEFSVPYNNDPATLEALFKLQGLNGNRIREVYLSGPQQYSGSGRIMDTMDEAGFVALLGRIHAQGIRANLVMNSTCEGRSWYTEEVAKEKLHFIGRMHHDHGLEAVTFANPLYIEAASQNFPDLEVGASVLCDIDSVQRATIYDRLGARVITPDVDINRNLPLLKQIKAAVKAELKIMVNDGCLYKCPFRRFHFNWISHKSKENWDIESEAFFVHCSQVTRGDKSQILMSNWIRPEDLERYGEVSRFFKIVGRERVPSWVKRATRAYLNQNWSGDMLEIISGSLYKYSLDAAASLDNKSLARANFFDKTNACDHDCQQCNYCPSLAEKLVTLGVPSPGKLEDLAEARRFFPGKGC